MPTKRVFPTRTLQHLASSAPHPRLRRVAEAELKNREDSLAKGGYITRMSGWVERAKQSNDGKHLVKTFGEEVAEEALVRWFILHENEGSPNGDKAYRQLKRLGGFSL